MQAGQLKPSTDIFKVRYWALIVVVPSVGFLFLLLASPIFVAFYSELNLLNSAKEAYSIIFESGSKTVLSVLDVIVISTSIGLLIQAIRAVWKSKQRRGPCFEWANRRTFCREMTDLLPFDANKLYNEQDFKELLDAHWSSLLNSCPHEALSKCLLEYPALYESIPKKENRGYSVHISEQADQTRKIRQKKVSQLNDSDKKKIRGLNTSLLEETFPNIFSSVFLRPGTSSYSKSQIYLERNREAGTYLEWEKFLHLLYEYMASVLKINLGLYALYGATTVFRYAKYSNVDWLFPAAFGTLLVATYICVRANKVHEQAYDAAQRTVAQHIISDEQAASAARAAAVPVRLGPKKFFNYVAGLYHRVPYIGKKIG